MTASSKSKFFFWSAFVAVTLVAAFFRFYHLGDHPLGLFFDPAINGLDALRLIQRGGPVLFFPTNGGREALLIYLLIPFLWLFGTDPFSFRLQLAIISLLNVVILFGFLLDLRLWIYDLRFWGKQPHFSQRENRTLFQSQLPVCQRHAKRNSHSPFTILLPTLGSLILAVSYWHITISRLDQRPLTVPLLSVLVFWFFLKGWTEGCRRWFILSGLFLGLSFHTYSAARLLPVILVLTVLPELFIKYQVSSIKHHAPRTRAESPLVSNLILFSVVTLLIASPMLWYFVTHPAQFSARAGSVMIWNFLDTPGDILAELGRNLVRVLGFFCCAGNSNAIFGLPGEPGLPLMLTPFLVVGLVVAVLNWRDLFARLVAAWWLVGIFPSIIAIEAPHSLRMIVALPPTTILVALGLITITCQVSRLTPHALRLTLYVLRLTFYALPFILILATIPGTFSAYFRQWPKLEVTQGIFDYGAIAIRDAINAHADESAPIYLPLSRYNDAPLLYYLSGPNGYQRQAALSASPAAHALIISPEKTEKEAMWVRLYNHTATLLPPLTAEGQQLIQAALADPNTTIIRTISGETAAKLASLPTDPAQFVQQPSHEINAAFGPAHLIGANYPFEIKAEVGQFPVTLFWQATGQMTDEYEVVLQLVDDRRRVWADGTVRPNDWAYPTTFWRPGLDTIASQQQVTFIDSPPPGRYWLAVAVYNPADGQRLPLAENQGDSPDTFFIGPLKIPLPPPDPVLAGEGIKFGNLIELVNFKINHPTLTAGESIQVELLWQTLQTPPLDYTVFIHLIDDDGQMVAGHDSQPVNDSYPTTIWTPAEHILDPHTLAVPADLPAGQYHLTVGLYYQPTGERLPVQLREGQPDAKGEFMLDTSITVAESQ